MGTRKKREGKQGIENLFGEIMTEDFLNLAKEKDTQVQEIQRVPNKMNPKRPTPRYSIIKMTNVEDRERILKSARGNPVTFKGVSIRLSGNF